jgi:hypothetical protein
MADVSIPRFKTLFDVWFIYRFQFIQCSVLTGLTVAKEASIVGSVTLSRNLNLGIDTSAMCLSCVYIFELIKFPTFSN